MEELAVDQQAIHAEDDGLAARHLAQDGAHRQHKGFSQCSQQHQQRACAWAAMLSFGQEVSGADGQKHSRECRQQEPEHRVAELRERADGGSNGRRKRIEHQQDARFMQVSAAE